MAQPAQAMEDELLYQQLAESGFPAPVPMGDLAALGRGAVRNVKLRAKDLVAALRSPKQTAMNAWEGVKAVARDPKAAGKAMLQAEALRAQQAVESPEALGEYAMGFVSPTRLLSAARGVPKSDITVYHGSPHRFERFDSSKIGTGEGAQAYGHGLYLAEAPDVAKQYRANRAYVGRTMAGQPAGVDFGPDWIAQNTVDELGSVDKAIAKLERVLKANSTLKAPGQAEENAKVLEAIRMLQNNELIPSGNLYTVDLPDPMVERMLDWDAPLIQQPQEVKNALTRIARQDEQVMRQAKELGRDAKANLLYAALTQNAVRAKKYEGMRAGLPESEAIPSLAFGQNAASSLLRSEGIPGIRYLDAGSRGSGTGTRNFVVFPGEEDKLRILRRE